MSRPPLNGTRLSTAELVTVLVERSAPDPHRPRCPPECEKRLARIELESAACYAQSELLTSRMRRLAQRIDAETEKSADCPEVDCDRTLAAIVDPGFDEDIDSVVVHMDQLRAATKID